jgi:sorbitol/mannitol transport system permease protein
VTAVLGALLFGLLLAVLLDRQFRGRAVARTLLITPFLIMPAASALVWKTSLLDPNNGIINWVLTPLGGANIQWASNYPMVSVVVFLIWQWTPFMMLLLLAGLQSQPIDILEAARVDGAGRWSIFVSLTLPHLRPYIDLCILLGCIYIVQSFDPVFLITQGGPGNATTNLPYFLYLETFRAGDVGLASAAGVLVVIVSNVIATLGLRLVGSVYRVGSDQ